VIGAVGRGDGRAWLLKTAADDGMIMLQAAGASVMYNVHILVET